MPQSPLRAPASIPDSFFADVGQPLGSELGGAAARQRGLQDSLPQRGADTSTWQPNRIMYWYDSIIDDMFANPGCSLRDTAARLGRSPVTIGLVVRSDLFKARYAQRRDQFNQELDHRLIGKLAQVAEAALDHTIDHLEKKRGSIPLPQLVELQNRALDRLGYGAQASGPSTVVQVNTGNAVVPSSVTAEMLAAARDKMKLVEGRAVGSDHALAPDWPKAARAVESQLAARSADSQLQGPARAGFTPGPAVEGEDSGGEHSGAS